MNLAYSTAVTSAMPFAIVVIGLCLAIGAPAAAWLGFQIYRDARDAFGAVNPRHSRRAMPRLRLRRRRPVRHDLLGPSGSDGQRGLEGPTGHLDPRQIARLLETR